MANAAAGVVTAPAGAAACQVSPSLRRTRTTLSPASSLLAHGPAQLGDFHLTESGVGREAGRKRGKRYVVSGQAGLRHLFSFLCVLVPSIWKSSVTGQETVICGNLLDSCLPWPVRGPLRAILIAEFISTPFVLHTARSCESPPCHTDLQGLP